jgi:anti-sigma B factor antagonist
MAFKITTRNLGGVTTVDLSGRLEIGDASDALRENLQSLAGGLKVLINLTDVSFVDTSGLGELVSAHTRAQNEGIDLKLAGIPIRVKKLFEMTKLDRIFDIYETEADALQSWGESPFAAEHVLSAASVGLEASARI